MHHWCWQQAEVSSYFVEADGVTGDGMASHLWRPNCTPAACKPCEAHSNQQMFLHRCCRVGGMQDAESAAPKPALLCPATGTCRWLWLVNFVSVCTFYIYAGW
jgi:hypothetical protein